MRNKETPFTLRYVRTFIVVTAIALSLGACGHPTQDVEPRQESQSAEGIVTIEENPQEALTDTSTEEDPRTSEDADSQTDTEVPSISTNSDPASASPTEIANNLAQTFPRSWSGSYMGHSSFSSTGDVERQAYIHLDTVNGSGAIAGTCEVTSEDAEEGHMHSHYTVRGSVNWETGYIALNGIEWIEQGDFSWMTNFEGTLSEDSLSITGRAYSARPGANTGVWNMLAIND